MKTILNKEENRIRYFIDILRGDGVDKYVIKDTSLIRWYSLTVGFDKNNNTELIANQVKKGGWGRLTSLRERGKLTELSKNKWIELARKKEFATGHFVINLKKIK